MMKRFPEAEKAEIETETTAITLGGKRGRVPLALHDGAAPRKAQAAHVARQTARLA